jgi:RNA polymerase sigma factor (sigma-70 family)
VSIFFAWRKKADERNSLQMKPNPSWHDQAVTHWLMINRMAQRRFPHGELAEEAALFVMDKLAEDNWRRLNAFTGQSTLATYIGALTLRLLEDFARSRYGRIKPPQWVRRLGGIWETLFRLLCLERYTPAEAVAILEARQACAPATAEKAAYQLLGEIPSCGAHRGEETGLPEDLPAEAEEISKPQQQMEQEEREQVLESLGRIVFAHARSTEATPLMERMLAVPIRLEPRERLLLKLCFRDGLSVAEAGRMLGYNRHQAHGRLRRLLDRLRGDLAAAGLDQEIRLLLADR